MTKLCVLLSLAILFVGCQSTPEATATKIAAVQVTTVDSAMQAWADWVRMGNATQAQVDAVKAAYTKYFSASIAEKNALTAYIAAVAERTNGPSGPVNPDRTQIDYHAALAAVAASQADLFALITQFQGKQP